MIVTYILYTLCAVYLVPGVVYAAFVLKEGIEPWYTFPLNVIFGPVIYLYNYYKFYKKGKTSNNKGV